MNPTKGCSCQSEQKQKRDEDCKSSCSKAERNSVGAIKTAPQAEQFTLENDHSPKQPNPTRGCSCQSEQKLKRNEGCKSICSKAKRNSVGAIKTASQTEKLALEIDQSSKQPNPTKGCSCQSEQKLKSNEGCKSSCSKAKRNSVGAIKTASQTEKLALEIDQSEQKLKRDEGCKSSSSKDKNHSGGAIKSNSQAEQFEDGNGKNASETAKVNLKGTASEAEVGIIDRILV